MGADQPPPGANTIKGIYLQKYKFVLHMMSESNFIDAILRDEFKENMAFLDLIYFIGLVPNVDHKKGEFLFKLPFISLFQLSTQKGINKKDILPE